MMLCDLKGGGNFLYEVMPSLFPTGELSEAEMILWELYYIDKKNRHG